MILFVGDKPSRLNTDPSVAFKGARCEARLNEWITFIGARPYHTINRTDYNFISAVMMWAAYTLPVVALGNNASKALGKVPHFKLPHPSGRNRQINDKTFINAKLEECRQYLLKFK